MSNVETFGYALFVAYLVAFFIRTAVAARMAGTNVWLFGAGAHGQRVPAALFRIAFAGTLAGPLFRRATDDDTARPAIEDWIRGVDLDLVGAVLVATGVCVALAAQFQMGKSWRIGTAAGQGGPLVAEGLFAISRNPVFLGQIAMFVGLLALFPDGIQLVLTVALVAAAVAQVRNEERALVASLGWPYLEYKRKVRRWL
jgi:protein-S-isoprenylcysteine O-methyltransferase Ste14